MPLKILTVLRRHASAPVPHVGPLGRIPPMDLPDTPPMSPTDWPQELGWTDPLAPGGRVDLIDPVGVVEPSDWERAYLQWLSQTLEAPLRQGWDDASAVAGDNHPELRSALAKTSPWSGPAQVPAGVVLRRVATRRGEAVAAARAIRGWLADKIGTPAAADACDRVLVLLPAGGATSLWADVLRRYDLPVRAVTATPLADAGLTRWVCGLAGLAGWDGSRRRSRDSLAAIFSQGFWSAAAVAEFAGVDRDAGRGLRRILRRRLEGLRGPSCTVDGWIGRLGDPNDREPAAQLEVAKAMARGLSETLAIGPFLVARLSAALFASHAGGGAGLRLGVGPAVRQLGDDQTSAALERIRGILAMLREEEREAGGEHPELTGRVGGDPGAALRTLLMRRFAGAATVEHLRPEAGVTLLPYDLYDGRPSGLLFATGLGEGGFPDVPAVPTEVQLQWLKLTVGGTDPEAWIEQAVERQLRLAAVAIGRCDGPVELSYSLTADGDRPVYPGALLSLLAGGWPETVWTQSTSDRVQDRSRADELPRALDQAVAWTEMAPLARGVQLPDSAEVEGELRRRVDQVRAVAEGLASTARAAKERRPDGESGTAEPGPYTGRLPGSAETGKALSPTSLERYGRCPTQYFFGKVLGVEDSEAADAEPDALESGSLIHSVLAQAAWQAREAASGLWDLGLDADLDDEARKRRVDDVVAEATAHLRETLADHARDTGISGPMMRRIADRWEQVLDNWVRANVTEVPPADLAGVDDLPSVAKMLEKLEVAIQDEPWIDRLVAQCEAGACTNKTAAGKFKEGGKIPKKEASDAFLRWDAAVDDDERAAVWQALRSLARDNVAAAESAWEEARAKERRRRSDAFHPHVAYAELSFGMVKPHAGADERSVLRTVDLPVDGGVVRVHGEADRIDVDPARRQFGVRDYKTGKSKLSEAKLRRDLAEGHHLQLTLYTLAVEELAKAGELPLIGDAEARVIALEYPRKAKPGKKPTTGSTSLDLRADTGLTLDGERASWTDVSRAWLGHHAAGIDAGRFDLLPTHCPLSRTDARCDFDRVCGYEPQFREVFRDDETAPAIAAVQSEPLPATGEEAPELNPPRFARLDAGPDTADGSAARKRHGEAVVTISDVSLDVVVSAGAGTGKTYNLVRRYLHALAAGASPQEILCVTFTRKAAAEMSHRVRAALLCQPDADLRPAVEALRADPERYRRILLTLSAAPISTIDALALRIVDEHERTLGDAGGEGRQVVDSSVVSEAIGQHVTEAFVEDLEGGDEDLAFLLDHVGPTALRRRLTEAVKGWDGLTDALSADEIESLWWSLTAPVADELQGRIAGLDLSEWQALFDDALGQTAATRRPNDQGERLVAEALSAAATLRDSQSRSLRERWRLMVLVLGCPTTGSSPINPAIGKNELRTWVKDRVVPIGASGGATFKTMKRAFDSDGQFSVWAKLSACAQRVVARWAADLSDRLRNQGRWRYQDVEREALRLLEDKDAAAAIGERLSLKHVFVDESQDTNAVQVRLVDRLVELTGARRFWVGDVKQSIYRFRGAEVDVFEDHLTDAKGAEVVSLTLNRRSVRPLIRSVNRLFGALLPARSAGVAMDPGAEVTYEPLGWDAARDQDDDAPRIELLTSMGRRWHAEDADQAATSADATEGDEAEAIGEGSDVELAIVRRIQERLQSPRRDGRLPDVAILVHSWARADRYRDLLALHGVSAVVQGGRGLLKTPEVDHLVQWLETVVLGHDVALVGALRGPGCSVSDAGLYCLRQGFGVTDDQGVAQGRRGSVRGAARWGRFDGAQALKDWDAAAARLDSGVAREALEADTLGVERFRRFYEGLERATARGRCAEGLRHLADEAGLWAWWGGEGSAERQRIANLHTFLDLVADEERTANSPAALVRRLLTLRDGDDPAAGGLDAGGEPRVIITTLWQAKGREWPIVVLPDLHLWTCSRDSAGFNGWRLLFPGPCRRVAQRVPGAVETTSAEPLEARPVPWVRELAGGWEMTAKRAELRRLLYVGMTRPREELLLSGVFDSPDPKLAVSPPGDPEGDKVFTLASANDWARNLLAATGLGFDPDGHPALGAGAWTSADVLLTRACDVEAPALASAATDEAQSRPLTIELAKSWAAIDSPLVLQIKPSDLKIDSPPAYDGRLGHWPVSRPAHRRLLPATLEGTVLHGVMEAWGYAEHPPDVELIAEQVRRHAPGVADDVDAVAEDLMAWVHGALVERQDLVDRLTAAASKGELFHEVRVAFREGAGLIEGDIDLVWREADGWHLLDYKWGVKDIPIAGERDILQKHYAQVRCYADGFLEGMPGESLVDFGVWYPATGLVLTWQ